MNDALEVKPFVDSEESNLDRPAHSGDCIYEESVRVDFRAADVDLEALRDSFIGRFEDQTAPRALISSAPSSAIGTIFETLTPRSAKGPCTKGYPMTVADHDFNGVFRCQG